MGLDHTAPRHHHPRVLMGLLFYPRGGSAQVTRALARALPAQGWDVTVVSSSLQLPGHPGDARAFFAGLDIHPLDCTAALASPDQLRADAALHPSYEDRPGAPDRVFAAVDDATYEHLTDVWARMLDEAGAAEADLLHLHHLTLLHAAAARVAPHVPIVGHLHGTELLMLEAIAQGPPAGWTHAAAWAERMRAWAAACQVLIVPSAPLVARAQALLGVDPERCVHLPNGFDPQQFDRRSVDRQPQWHHALVSTRKAGVLVALPARSATPHAKYAPSRRVWSSSTWDATPPSSASMSCSAPMSAPLRPSLRRLP